MQTIQKELKQTKEVFDAIFQDAPLQEKILSVANICVEALKNGNKIMFCGNGGSAADSQHLAAELVARFNFNRAALAAISLTTDTSALTAIGNDFGFEQVFVRQVEALGKGGDILFGFSTSGRSKNVLLAFEKAKEIGITTIGMLGQEGRDIGNLSSIQVNIPSIYTPKIQEGHICIGHIICGLIEEIMFGEK